MAKKKAKKTKSKKSTTKISVVRTMKTTLPSVGSYYIRPKANGQSFSLYLKRYEKGKPIKPHEKIDPAIYYRFGISADMTATDAKIKLDEFRKLNKASRLDVARQDRAFKRYNKARTINQVLFPQDLVDVFEERIRLENFGTQNHLKKKLYIFSTVQEIMNHLKITPEVYAENSKIIFKYFADHQYSMNYCQKLISMMNDWGKFASGKGSGFFKIIPQPKGNAREKINDQSQMKTGVRKEALPMTEDLLRKIIGLNQLETTEINFFKATFYLGLRPEELMRTPNGGKHYSKVQHISGVDVVSIYQEKLKGVPDNKRTKHIPIKWDEQKEAIKIIEDQSFKKPTYKAIKKIARALNCNSGNKALGLYSGRKGFTNWCFDKGEKSFQSVASWLGHLDPTTTFSIYRDREQVMLGDSGTPPKASGE